MSQPPKRDKFAALASQQQQTATAAAAAAAAPRRDKFASMAAAQEATSTTTTTTTQQQQPASARRDKFAAVRQQKKEDDRQQKQQAIVARCHQRNDVWKDLDSAEGAVARLLKLAEQTSETLAEQTTTAEKREQQLDSLKQMQSKYCSTLQEIHGLLSPYAEHVKAYQAPSRVNRMYLQRVEHRIAESKRQLLQDYLQQEKKTAEDGGDGRATTTSEITSEALIPGKRKREE